MRPTQADGSKGRPECCWEDRPGGRSGKDDWQAPDWPAGRTNSPAEKITLMNGAVRRANGVAAMGSNAQSEFTTRARD